MSELTVTSKGQVTLRREALRHLGVRPGDKIDYELGPEGRIVLSAKARGKPISRLFGMLKREGDPKLSIDEVNEIIADSWAGLR
jgi:bifunctional DNA-binding transcriptional regulator/antitoxin component of YhaV-PrlF toxin-antitoxin module